MKIAENAPNNFTVQPGVRFTGEVPSKKVGGEGAERGRDNLFLVPLKVS